MLAIKKTGEGYYLATLTGEKEELGRNECHLMKKGIKSIASGGFHILHELKNIADARRCKIRFINAEPSVETILAELTQKKTRQHNILEFD